MIPLFPTYILARFFGDLCVSRVAIFRYAPYVLLGMSVTKTVRLRGCEGGSSITPLALVILLV